jgi:tetratricopeptide (TPR) repeat protein
MVDMKPGITSYNRASYARWLYGDVRGATRYMLMAIHAGSTQPENVAWCQSQLGDDYFNAGFVLGAEQQYRAALHTFPHQASAMAGMAQVEIALGHPKAAIRWYRKAIAVVPLPQYITGLGDLYTSLGKTADAARQYATVGLIQRIYRINHIRFGVEEAQFDADHDVHLAQALAIARREAQTRRDSFTMDTLAWALYKNGQDAQALKAEKSALRLGTRYALYYFHAGMIEAKLGNRVEAQSDLQNALMTNPNFHPVFARTARLELQRINQQVSQG